MKARAIRFSLLSLTLLAGSVACDDDSVGPDEAGQVVIADDSVSMEEGQTLVMEAFVLDEDGALLDDADVEWRTTAAGVAIVDEDGEIRALAAGVAGIIAYLDDAADTVVVTVTDSGPEDPGLEAARMKFTLGASGDLPLPDDYDGDGDADAVVFRSATSSWYFGPCASMASCESATLGTISGDIPVPADYDGDGAAEIAVFATGADLSGNGVPDGYWLLGQADCRGACASDSVQWGQLGDVPLPANYEVDNAAEIAIARPGEGYWYISVDNCSWEVGCDEAIHPFAPAGGDIPVPGDYDGDGFDEMAFYRPSEGQWHVADDCIVGCDTTVVTFGSGLGVPVPGDYDGDGITDMAHFRASTGMWTIRRSSDPSSPTLIVWGENAGEIPAPADYDGDGTTDIAVYRLESGLGTWYVR